MSIHSPINAALEAAILMAIRHDMRGLPESTPGGKTWALLERGAVAAGAIGLIEHAEPTRGWLVCWGLYPDDEFFYGFGGDGQGDVFAVTRDSVKQFVKLRALAALV